MSLSGTPLLEMRKMSKSFGSIEAVVDVDLVLYPGEILGVVGDNAAGKSTLMKLLTAVHKSDTGEIFVDGEQVVINDIPGLLTSSKLEYSGQYLFGERD